MFKKKTNCLNAITFGLVLSGLLASSISVAAVPDAASQMPDISQKKILVGYWHNWGTTPGERDKARGYQGGLPSDISLRDVPQGYNVVSVSFMKVMDGQSGNIPTFKPYNVSDEAFRADVAELNAQGRAVLISLGGADAHIELHKGQEQALADEVIRLVETYGFDGLDIDLEQSAITAADNSTVIPAALKIVRAHYQQQGKHFIISMAPEFPYLQANRGVNYKAYLQNLAGEYDFIAPQYYNQAGDGVNMSTAEEVADAGSWWLPQDVYGGSTARQKEMFLFYLTDSLANGSRGYVKIPASKLVIGLPANADAAGSGYVKDPQSVYNALARLEAANEPIKGLMTWSVNWDNGVSKSGQRYGYEFLTRYQSILDGSLPDNGGSQPDNGGSQPDNGGSQPDNGGSQPDNGGSQPDNGGSQPDNGGSQPDNGGSQPDNGGSQPDNGGSQPDNDVQAPGQVQGVKATLTEGKVMLSWQRAQDNVDVAGYTVWRDQEKVADIPDTHWRDNQVEPGKTYSYTVVAYDAANNFASPSLPVTVTIPQSDNESGEQENGIAAFTPGKAYAVGDKVIYSGKVYRCLNAHTAASHWAPDVAVSLWAAE